MPMFAMVSVPTVMPVLAFRLVGATGQRTRDRHE
jgi:hypothetical protein